MRETSAARERLYDEKRSIEWQEGLPDLSWMGEEDGLLARSDAARHRCAGAFVGGDRSGINVSSAFDAAGAACEADRPLTRVAAPQPLAGILAGIGLLAAAPSRGRQRGKIRPQGQKSL